MDQDNPIAFDIETNPVEGRLLCISFACEPARAVSVPWRPGYYDGIRTLLSGRHAKITQNGQYDCYWLAQEGFTVNNWRWDAMAMSCLLWPGEPHSLAYLASILTREPWYKGGDDDTHEKVWATHAQVREEVFFGEYQRAVDLLQTAVHEKWRALLDYNAKDAAVTWECWAGLRERLEAKGWKEWMDVYLEQYQALFQPMLRTMLHGMRVEKEELHAAFVSALEQARQALAGAAEAADCALFTFGTQVQEACWRVRCGEWDRADPTVAKKLARARGDEARYVAQVEAKGISNQILAAVLYDAMKLPVQRLRRERITS